MYSQGFLIVNVSITSINVSITSEDKMYQFLCAKCTLHTFYQLCMLTCSNAYKHLHIILALWSMLLPSHQLKIMLA